MAVRFDTAGEFYDGTLTLGAQAAYTVAAWVRIATNTVANTGAVSVHNGTGDYMILGMTTDGVTATLFDETASGGATALTVGTWYYLAASVNGTAGTLYIRPSGGTSTTQSVAGMSANLNMASVRVGDSVFGGTGLNGNVTAVKIWTAALSQAELDAEWNTFAAVRGTNLVARYELKDNTDTADYSGNGHTLTATGTITTEPGPSELVSAAVPRQPVVAVGAAVQRSVNW